MASKFQISVDVIILLIVRRIVLAFFLIVPSVMIVSVFLVRGILNQFGLKISYGALAMCAVLSFAANLAAIASTPVPGQEYFYRLSVLIFAASIAVTLLNRFLVREPATIPPQVPPEPAKVPDAEIKLPPPKPKTEKEQLIKKVADKLNSKPDGKFFKDKPAAPPVEAETLDEILDRAYAEKMNGSLSAAISDYKKALEIYGSDDYAPFVAIDLGNIYKEQASYTNAIKIYETALNLPAVKRSAATTNEFQKNLAYLRTVHLILLKHDALSTPFSKISPAYLQEIEAEFQATQAENI